MAAAFRARRAPAGKFLTLRKLQNQVQHQKRQRRKAAAKLEAALASKVSGRIQRTWFVRVGLADPSVPATTLEDFLTSFPESETKSISKTYIGT
eukprot:9349417-Pyramimonas_sp.AAC.1